MANETPVAAYRAALRPSDQQAAVLAAHAEYAATARRWAEARPDRTSVKALYKAFKESDVFDEALSGTVAERAIAGVVDRVEIGGGRLFNAADAGRHGSKHVKVQDVAPVRRRGEVVRDACQRLRLPKTGGVEIEGDRLSMEGRAIREAWIGREGGAWLVEIVLSTRVLVRTCKVRMRATKAQRAVLRALAGRVDAVWNAIGVVVWAAGVKLDGKGRATREALHAKLETKLAGQPQAVCASARAVFGEGRERPYADTRMVKGWSRDESLAVVDADHRLTQAVICEVAAQYRASQDLKLDRLKDRARKKAGQRKKDAEVKAGRRLAAAYAKTGEVAPGLLVALSEVRKAKPAPHMPKVEDHVLMPRDSSPAVRCPASGCAAVFPRTRARCPECGQGRQPKKHGEASARSTTRKTGWIPLRDVTQGAYALEWENGVYRARLRYLGALAVTLDEPERLAGRAHRTATVTEDARGRWHLAVAYEEPAYRPVACAPAIGVNVGLREMVTTSAGESFVMPRYRARDAEAYGRLQGARGGKTRKAGRPSTGRNQPKLKRLATRQASKRRQRHREIARALLHMPSRRYTEAPLGRAPEGEGRPFSPPHTIYVGSWRPATEGREDRWQFVDGCDQAVTTFVQVLKEQADRVGSRVVHVEEAFTTMTCAACGTERDAPVPQGTDRWECGRCGTVHDRYVNAARNILQRGLEQEGRDA